ncbi:glyoxalase-like domain-containing protein [Calycina marina]|uniref:Glyoxalase-like domain-containing protein n=1 Tax=Calycina marina TaxID=1763456 RepID=A0A9P7YW74_9HELO|nr:glyoxalase-like domain-containing protein [Calycina marina]
MTFQTLKANPAATAFNYAGSGPYVGQYLRSGVPSLGLPEQIYKHSVGNECFNPSAMLINISWQVENKETMVKRQLILDHVVILVPYAELAQPPSWITDSFTISSGGRHADGKTENRLVIFQDGSYIELIAFIHDDPKLREGHWWDKPFGIVDFAFTTVDGGGKNYAELQTRLEGIDGCEARYEKPRQGSRKRDDGQELHWHVTFPNTTNGYRRGELPFFCHDITDRSLRVPSSEKSTTHPSFAYGLKALTIFVPETRIEALIKAFSAIFDAPNARTDGTSGTFAAARVNQIDGAAHLIAINIEVPREDWQVQAMEKRGGAMIGDMIVGGFSLHATPGHIDRLDTENPPYGIGRFLQGLDLPLDRAVDGGCEVNDNEKNTTEAAAPSFANAKPNTRGFKPPSGNLSGFARS